MSSNRNKDRLTLGSHCCRTGKDEEVAIRLGEGMEAGDVFGRRGGGARGQRNLKQLSGGMKVLAGRLSVALVVLLICTISLFSTIKETGLGSPPEIDVNKLWRIAASDGWRPSSAPRFNWHPPPAESNGYLKVRCNGGLNQQRSAICNAVLAAR